MTSDEALAEARTILQATVAALTKTVQDSDGGCEPQEEVPCDGDPECCLLRRIEYLIALLICETEVNPVECCAKAYQKYLDGVSEC